MPLRQKKALLRQGQGKRAQTKGGKGGGDRRTAGDDKGGNGDDGRPSIGTWSKTRSQVQILKDLCNMVGCKAYPGMVCALIGLQSEIKLGELMTVVLETSRRAKRDGGIGGLAACLCIINVCVFVPVVLLPFPSHQYAL